MQKRRLGRTDMELTTVGLGTWAMGGPWQFGWGPQDDGEAVAAVLAALDEGINWIDTAPAYGLGHSEELVGQALRQTGHKPYIATKCGLLWNEKKEKVPCLKPESIRAECHASLERMARLADEGKVRYIGVSNFNVDQLERAARIRAVSSLQPPYSMLRREAEHELLGYCEQHEIGVVVYSPMQRGLLTGRFSPERLAGLPLDDHRRRQPDFQEPQFSANLELVEELTRIAERSGRTCAQLAVSWVLRRREVTAAIVGARRPDQIAETVKASDWDLSPTDIDEIEELLAARAKKLGDK